MFLLLFLLLLLHELADIHRSLRHLFSGFAHIIELPGKVMRFARAVTLCVVGWR